MTMSVWFIKMRKKTDYSTQHFEQTTSQPALIGQQIGKKNSTDAIFMPKTHPSEIDSMEDMYRLSNLQIKKREVIVEN